MVNDKNQYIAELIPIFKRLIKLAKNLTKNVVTI